MQVLLEGVEHSTTDSIMLLQTIKTSEVITVHYLNFVSTSNNI
jgi:hypothetical protein